jgi:hypothetical protein
MSELNAADQLRSSGAKRANAAEEYLLTVADIAMAAAIGTHDSGYVIPAMDADYVPGSLREGWLAGTNDIALQKRVTAMASAAAGPLQAMSPEQLVIAATKYGVPLAPGLAQRMAAYFDAKRNAVLSYNR